VGSGVFFLKEEPTLTIHKAPFRLIMTYACPASQLAADTYLLKLQRLENKVLRTN
jgi:hypothetical protein